MVEVLFIGCTGNMKYIVSYQSTFYIIDEAVARCTKKWRTYLVPESELTVVLEKE